MALVGVLSTQLLHRQLVRGGPSDRGALEFRTFVDRLAAAPGIPAAAPRRDP
jgi:hypothetical protein